MTEQRPISGASRDYGSTSNLPGVTFSEPNQSELYSLIDNVSDSISTINSGLKSLDKMMRQVGGPNDNMQLRDKIHNTQQSVNSSVSATASDMQRLNVIVKNAEKPQILLVERLTSNFKEAIDKYSKVQKQLSQKLAEHMPKQPRPKYDPALLEQQQAIADDDEAQLIANQQSQARQIQFDTGMLLEREAYINQIEADVLDVNQIMQDLSKMVHSQGEVIDSIQSHIEDGGAHVEEGTRELAKAAEHQRRYRKKMFVLILIGIVLGIILIVWIVKAFK